MSVFGKRDQIVLTARALLGVNEADGSHYDRVVSLYNMLTPLPRNYRMTRTDAWCAAFVSVVMKVCDIENFPYECGVTDMWDKACKQGLAIKGRAPMFGDVAVFTHSHVGIVETFRGGEIHTIEGNANDKCMRRVYTDLNKFRGFFMPYKPSLTEVALQCIKGVYGNDEREKLLNADGWSLEPVRQEINRLVSLARQMQELGISRVGTDLDGILPED